MRYEQFEWIGERVDKLVNLDVPGRGVIERIYPLARAAQDGPLCLLGAELISARVQRGSAVLIATGWPDRPHISGRIAETDGPPGAAALARALHRALGAVPIVLIEEASVEGMAKVLQAAGFRVLSAEEAMAATGSHAPIHAAAVLPFPAASREAAARSLELVDRYDPSAVIVIEKGGENEQGKIHTSRGADTSGPMAKVDELVKLARSRGIASIGIGDGGNEIGMGTIHDALQDVIPYGRKCLCGCGGGIVPVNPTDVLITGAVSNWAAYGVSACLAVLSKEASHLHDEVVEERILRAASDASFIDGITGYVEPGADGLPLSANQAVVTLLREIVRAGLRVSRSHGAEPSRPRGGDASPGA